MGCPFEAFALAGKHLTSACVYGGSAEHAAAYDHFRHRRSAADRAARNITHGLAVVGALASAPEVCICAAIRLPDGRVFRGHRHNHCMDAAAMRADVKGDDVKHADQGFVTSRNRYVDREEGMRLQKAAGIESANHGGYFQRDLLFSEDLYR